MGLKAYFDTLMNQQIMHKKVSQAIQGCAQPYPKSYIKPAFYTPYEEQAAWYSKNQKKEIIPYGAVKIN